VLLDDPAEAPQRIDHALARCIAEKRPIMIEIPADMVDRPCTAPGPFAAPVRPPSDPDGCALPVVIERGRSGPGARGSRSAAV